MELIFDKSVTEVKRIEDKDGNILWERQEDDNGGALDNE